MATPRRGNQSPTFTTVRSWARTDGDYAAGMFGEYGVRFYGSQAHELRVFLARKGDGSYAATTICVSKPRQNGKSFAARFYALWMAAIEGRNVLYSAHHGKTVRKMFKALRAFVEAHPDFEAMLRPNGRGVYAAAGSEGIYFVDEDGNDFGMVEFQTRTNSAGRGETYHVIIVDEAQELTDEQQEAIKPTTFAAGDVSEVGAEPQMIYLGTPPGPKCPGTVFRDFHDKAHADLSTSIWWMEWAVGELPDMADKEAVLELAYLTNPAMGYRIKESTMREAIDTMTRADGFARECLGWWSRTAAVAHPIVAADWDARATADPPKGGRIVYAVKFRADGSEGALASCVAPDGGPPHVELVDVRSLARGTGWFADFAGDVADVATALVVDGRSNAQNLVDRLESSGFDMDLVVRPSAADMANACASFVEAVRSGGMTHFAQPDLDNDAKGCGKRRIGAGGGFGFESSGGADATTVEACALAYWWAETIRRNPPSELRIG